ncbi:uncharacterized protein BDZ99DRAFT_568247 [Mytilinidion resinicola]|uniref:DUF6594 domain-containing protein n=1 Tax=Mytilinidion resinicola TaxID=574789 RepID=A0A6A6YX43_9PEZI|nr:uncharacterized protein BDZ99DRAFT_568247 [Mytilinidion resinicola]KAF2812973.1 hypothetical protein BDZ99DRAFT_568247 [Mytilinidion resinicola]
MRMRLLLLKQDEISILEESLDKIDAAESRDFFLGCGRKDRNPDRQEVLQKLGTALGEYDLMMEQSRRILSFPQATSRDMVSLKNWIEGVGSISSYETAYLGHSADQVNITGSADDAVTSIEATVEACLLGITYFPRQNLSNLLPRYKSPITKDRNMFILGPGFRMFSRVLTTWVAAIILLVPVIILYLVASPRARLVVIALTTGFFLSLVSVYTKARTIEVIVAGASYAAVLVVFKSSNNGMKGNLTPD